MNNTPNKTIVILLWTISIVAISLLILQAHIGGVQKTPKQIQADPSLQTTDSLGALTPDRFKERFNAAADTFDNRLKITTMNIMAGVTQDTFNIRLAKHISLLGILDNDGNLRSVTIIGLGDGSIGSDTDTTLAIGILVASFNPTLSFTECYQIIKDTGIADNNSSTTGQTTQDGKRYFYNRSYDNKIMFSVSKATPGK